MNEGQFMKISFRIFDVPRFGEHKHRSFIFQPACKMHFFWRAKINFTWLERWRKMQNAKWKMKIERRQRRIKATWKTIFLLRQMPRVATTHRQKHRCQSSFFSLKFKMLMHISLMTFVRCWNLASRHLRDDVIIVVASIDYKWASTTPFRDESGLAGSTKQCLLDGFRMKQKMPGRHWGFHYDEWIFNSFYRYGNNC